MKRKLLTLIALVLLCAVVSATGEVADYLKGLGFSPTPTDSADTSSHCDFILASTAAASVEWGEAGGSYAVSGAPEELAPLYMAMLELSDWQTCRYVLGNRARVAYGDKASRTLETLEAFKVEMGETLAEYLANSTAAPEPAQAALQEALPDQTLSQTDEGNYVLNTNTKKFHLPNCASVGQMKDKNRQYYTGSREDLIAQGYAPCKNCKP